MLAALGVLHASAGLAQTGDLEARLGAETYRAIRPILAGAERDSLPVAALESKALEGAAKRRPPSQIAQVVTGLAHDLRVARSILREAAPGGALSGAEIVAAAEAARRGVPGEEIRALRAAVPPSTPLEIAFAVLGELVQRQVPVAEAREAIEIMLEDGVPRERMIEIPPRVDVALRVGATPGAALGSALHGIGVLRAPGQLKRPPKGRKP
jgi:hypothetical protein